MSLQSVIHTGANSKLAKFISLLFGIYILAECTSIINSDINRINYMYTYKQTILTYLLKSNTVVTLALTP